MRPYEEIGERLRLLRKALGLRQVEFCARHGFSTTQYNNWERGNRRINLDAAMVLEQHYGFTMSYLYFGKANTLSEEMRQFLKLASRR